MVVDEERKVQEGSGNDYIYSPWMGLRFSVQNKLISTEMTENLPTPNNGKGAILYDCPQYRREGYGTKREVRRITPPGRRKAIFLYLTVQC